MFCHQCQEMMRNTGCNAAKGVCGKTDEVANLQDLLLHVCKGIGFWGTRALDKGAWHPEAVLFTARMLFATITNANFSTSDFERWILEAIVVRDGLRDACVAAGARTDGPLPDAAAWKAAFGLDDVNALPISFDIAWYEQKAVLVLLALLHLGFKNIRLGPTLPGFLSPAVASVLVQKFGIRGIADARADVVDMMAGR